ncbi:MAG: MBL fold metallo-hydrolase [Clostridia bacterium]|nr:MBL fold metallo-hydrolase [Clostridia bacterium]
MAKSKKKLNLLPKLSVFLIAAVLILCGMAYEYFTNTPADFSDAVFSMHVIDVGQGDSILIRSGDKTMLIDAGESSAKADLESYLNSQEITKLDYVVCTHPHSDHIGGMENVLRKYDYDNIIMPKVSHTSKTFISLLECIDGQNKEITEAKSGAEFTLGEAKVKILAPNSSDYDELNDWSVVLKITVKGKSFILTGDAEKLSEEEILNIYAKELNCDVYKVGHHGSKSSSSNLFVAAMTPKYSAISVAAKNSYKHPSDEVVKRLEMAGSEVLTTADCGDIVFFVTADGALGVKTEKTK